jgi:hypothetical protein
MMTVKNQAERFLITVPGIADALHGGTVTSTWNRPVQNAQNLEQSLSQRHYVRSFVETALGKKIPGISHGASNFDFSGLGAVEDERYAASLDSGASLLLRGLHSAFGLHRGFSLSPAMLWYVVLSETALYVGTHAEQCAPIFGATGGQKRRLHIESLVQFGDPAFDWSGTIVKWRPKLEEAMPNGGKAFFPEFSGLSDAEKVALQVGVMDCGQKFFEYTGSTMCGIPRVELQGTVEDWKQLAASIRDLQGLFAGMDIAPYYEHLAPVVDKIVAARSGGGIETDFWNSLYKYKSGSGGPHVTGWITMFVAHTCGYEKKDRLKLREFAPWGKGWAAVRTDFLPSHISSVPVTWNFYGTIYNLNLIGGITGLEYSKDEEMIRPQLGWMMVDA